MEMLKKIFFLLSILFPLFSYSQWHQTEGPYGGNVNTFYNDNDKLLYVGTTSGLYVKKSESDKWDFIDIGRAVSVTAITKMGKRLFIGTGNGIFCSPDNGNTWNQLNTGLSTYYRFCGYCIKGFSVIENTIFAATGNGLLKLSNNDTAWTYTSIPFYYSDEFAAWEKIMISSEETRYGPGSSTKITTDGGLTTRNISFPGEYSYTRDLAISLDVSRHGIFAITVNGLFHSKDNGYNWKLLYNETDAAKPTFVKVVDDKIFLGTLSKGLFVSNVNNINWLNAGLVNFKIQDLFKYKKQLFVGLGYNRGVYKSSLNLYIWEEYNIGLSAIRTYVIESSGDLVIAGCQGGVYISRDSGFKWEKHVLKIPGRISDEENKYVQIEKVATDGRIILAGANYIDGVIFISKDAGTTWKMIDKRFNNLLSGLAINGNKIFIATSSEFYVSEDNGQNLSEIQFPENNGLNNTLRHHSGKLYISGRDFFSSKDNGQTWENIAKPQSINPNSFRNLLVTDSVLMTINGLEGLYIGDKNGNNWFLSYSSPGSTIYSLAIKEKKIILYNGNKIMQSDDLGLNWEEEIFFNKYSAHAMGFSKDYIFASIPGQGIFRYGDLKTSLSKFEAMTDLMLFPNPSSGIFTISNRNMKNSSVRIFNGFGSMIYNTTLISNQTSIDLSAHSAGIYLIEIEAGEKREVRKIVIK